MNNIFYLLLILTLSASCSLEVDESDDYGTSEGSPTSPLKNFSGLPIELIQTIKSFRRQALHAELLGFKHPETEEWCEFKTNLPEDFSNLLTELQKS